MKIGVFGAGGVGGYFGGKLAQMGQHEVSFIARGEHLAAIQRDGLRVRNYGSQGMTEDIIKATFTDDPATVGAVDIVLFSVKVYDVENTRAIIHSLIGDNTKVITLQNGLDSPYQLAEVLGADKVVAGAARIEATIEAPGIVARYSADTFPASLEFAELQGQPSPQLQAFYEACQAAEIPAKLETDPKRVLWTKFLFLASMSGMTSLTRANVGEIFSHPASRELYAAVVSEIAAVAKADGIEWPAEALERFKNPGFPPTSKLKSSMQRDFERGKFPTELNLLTGRLIQLGKQYNIPTPYNDTIYGALSLAEKIGYRYASF